LVRGDDFGIEGEGVWFLGEEERMGRGKRRRKEGRKEGGRFILKHRSRWGGWWMLSKSYVFCITSIFVLAIAADVAAFPHSSPSPPKTTQPSPPPSLPPSRLHSSEIPTPFSVRKL